MRNLMFVPVVFFAAVQLANADDWNFNAAQPQAPDTQTATVSHNLGHEGAHEVGHGYAGCPTGNCQHGSLDQFPGGCCDRQGHCCAALWADYCRDKKWCSTAQSPRRHTVGCGFALPVLPNLNPFHGMALTHPWGTPDCDVNDDCDLGPDSGCSNSVSAVEGALDRALENDPANAPHEGSASSQDAATTEDTDASDAQPALDPPSPSALKSGFPFGFKLPLKPQSNQYRSMPTARSKPLFSR
jgi:hypothetical protein